MDQNPNQGQPDQNQQPPYEPSTGGVPQYPVYGGVPAGDPSQYPSYGAPQYPPYGPPMGMPPYPPYPYPYPVYMQQPPQKSSKLWLWVLLGIIGACLVACIISCALVFTTALSSVNTSVQSQDAAATALATPDNNNAPSANIQTVSIGQAVTIQDIACTLSSVKPIAGDSTAAPQSGDEFIVVDIKLSNHSQQALQYNAFDFYVVDSTGKARLNSTVVPNAYKQQLSGGTLAPGQSIEGKLVFEVTKNDHKQTLNWQPSFNVSPQNSNIGAWNLGL